MKKLITIGSDILTVLTVSAAGFIVCFLAYQWWFSVLTGLNQGGISNIVGFMLLIIGFLIVPRITSFFSMIIGFWAMCFILGQPWYLAFALFAPTSLLLFTGAIFAVMLSNFSKIFRLCRQSFKQMFCWR